MNIARDIVATDHIQNDIGAFASCRGLHHLHKILLPVVNSLLCPQLLTSGTLFRTARRGEHTYTQIGGDLNGRGTDARRAAVHQ